jgi:hypothetical protein
MALPQPSPPPAALERPPQAGWYWNRNGLARAWLPLIGLEGLGLLDFYLAMADHRPGSPAPGWAAVTLDELVQLTGWGRARLIRLNRLLSAAGLLAVRRLPVAGRGPAVQRALYQVRRQAGPPTAATLARLAALAERDPALAARLRRYTGSAAGDPEMATPAADPADTPGAAAMPAPAPVRSEDPGPVPAQNRSEDLPKTRVTTTSGRAAGVTETPSMPAPCPAEHGALVAWQAANGRPASQLERQRLAQLATQVSRQRSADAALGWRWVAEAIAEAVEAGSAFVAPRRLARILARWLAEGRDDRPAAAGPGRARPRRRDPGVGERRAPVARHSGERPTSSRPGGDCPPGGGGGPAPAVAAAPVEAAWQPPAVVAGLPAAPAAVLRAALAAAGLLDEPFLRGAALAGWADGPTGERPVLRVATPAPLPPATAARLQPRLAQALGAVAGRPVGCRLVARAALGRDDR